MAHANSTRAAANEAAQAKFVVPAVRACIGQVGQEVQRSDVLLRLLGTPPRCPA